MTKIQNIAKNTSYLTLALILQKVISFTYFTLLARFLGPADLGKYYFAISFTTIFSIFIDLGFSNILIRETAKSQEKAGIFLGNILAMKLPLAILSLASVVGLINLFHYDPLIKTLVYISCFSMVFDSFTLTFFSVARGHHNLKYESISSVIFQAIVLIAGYGALLLGGGLIPAMAALTLASSFNLIYSWRVVVKKLGLAVRLAWDKSLARELLLVSWPFAAYAIFQRFYTYLDTVLLSLLAGDAQVGLYQVAFKIIFALQFLPMAFTASLYPALSAYWKDNRAQLEISFERAINYLTIISWPIIIGSVLLAPQIVLIFKGGFSEAVLPLQISIVSLFFMFVNFPIGSLLNACDRQRRNTLNMAITTAASIGLNLILIPRYQAVGASITVLATNILMFALGLSTVWKIISYHPTRNLRVLFKSLLSASLMGALILIGKRWLPISALIMIGGVAYFFFLYLLRGFRREDIASILKSFKI